MDAKRAVTNKRSNPTKSGVAEAWMAHPSHRSRPAAANHLAQQLQTVPSKDGLFGRYSAQPTPDPYNPGSASGPRSITVLSSQANSDSSITTHDGFETELTDKSCTHLTSKHGHSFGVDDPLPPDPNQKPTKYKQVRTRITEDNKLIVLEEIKSILSNKDTEVYTEVSIRGVEGRVYYCKDTNRVVGIHTEGKLSDKIIKAQPISEQQLALLIEFKVLD